MIDDWRLAEALALHKLHGAPAASWAAERQRALETADDYAGVKRFTAIAGRLDELTTAACRPC